MNVIFLVPDYYPHVGGVERHARNVAMHLIQQGCTVTVFVEKRRPAERPYEIESKVEIFRFIKKNYFVFRKLSFKWQFIKNIRIFSAADVIHFHDFSTMWLWGVWVHFILRCMGKKIFITFHGWEGHVPPQRKTVYKRKICEYLADGNICIGHFIEKWYGTTATRVIYGGCHPEPVQQRTRQHALFMGRLEKDTGIREYIRSWQIVNQTYPTLELIVCGEGSLQQDLLDLIEKHGIQNVQFRGFVQDPERMMKEAVFVFTSGFLGILEAFSTCTPVVTTYDNALKKDYLLLLPGATEMLWVCRDVDSIYRAIDEILSADISEKINKAYTFAMKNTWNKVAAEYLELYRQHG